MGKQANVSKENIRDKICKDKDIKDKNNVSLFGFRTQFGGQASTGFCLIYNDEKSRSKYEPKYRLRRLKLLAERTGSAKQKKERKNKLKKLRGKKKREAQ